MSKKSNIIKDINLNKLRKALKEAKIATKPQLSQLTGLSVVTVNSLVNTLIAVGEILTDEVLNSEGGRPALSYRYNSNYRLALAIYMHEYKGEDKAFYCVIDLHGEVIERMELTLSEVAITSFDCNIEALLAKYPQIQAICFGIPGEEVNQRLIISDYENMRNQSLSGYIHGRFHLPVHVENDINAAIMGYSHQNNISNDQCVIGLYFPEKYPPGGGIYLNGKVYKGRNGLAGEIKYLPFAADWEVFDYMEKDYDDFMVKTIQAFLCMYNPDRIIIYGDSVKKDIAKSVQNNCVSQIEKIMVPDIIVSEELNRDFEIGVKLIALTMINTEYDIER